MSVLIGNDTKVLVQGMGKTGRFHTDRAIAYGTEDGRGRTSRAAPAGSRSSKERRTTRGCRAGETASVSNCRSSSTVAEAVAATGADASVVYVPPPFAADAIMEAADAGVPLVVCITEGASR